MASHVVVIDTSARRHIIKTTPGKHLSDVLQEACVKFGLNPDQYSLKHNNKPVDLSRTIRLSGLSSGAKLDLVQSSRSPAVVSVALQLPPTTTTTGSETGNLSRVTDKFPSNTPIWQILRRFEAGAAGTATTTEKANYNFTQRATPQMSSGTSGAGRLCYEMPVVNIMGRELSSFVDLQKTLGQLGFNSGSCLLRLSYRATEQPLEEAMTEISQYFKALEEPVGKEMTDTRGAHGLDVGRMESKLEVDDGAQLNDIAGEPVSPSDTPMEDTTSTDAASQPTIPNSSSRHDDIPQTASSTTTPATPNLVIYAPPTSSTPAAASQTPYDESDYIPTIDHATRHQARLLQESRNRRLPSDSELAAQHQERLAALSEIKDVVVRLRFPDQSQAQMVCGREASVSTLYERCREMMRRPGDERFELRVPGGKGMGLLVEGEKTLIGELGWQGRVLVTVVWGDDVSAEVKKGPSLKDEYRAKEESLKVDVDGVKEVVKTEEKIGGKEEKEMEKGKKGGAEKEAKMMKFLKGLSKK